MSANLVWQRCLGSSCRTCMAHLRQSTVATFPIHKHLKAKAHKAACKCPVEQCFL